VMPRRGRRAEQAELVGAGGPVLAPWTEARPNFLPVRSAY
jgi:hypothetical protein